MLNGDDKGTFYALRLLRDVVDERRKPLIIWAGAGVSKWCGFPLWQEVAEHFHKVFRRSEPTYDRSRGDGLLKDSRFPDLFELLRKTSSQRYNRELASLFTARAATPVYARFLDLLRGIAPLQVVTTNIDDALERNLPAAAAIQKSDLERCLDLVGTDTSFVAKLHGSVSAVESVVFTAGDYQELLNNQGYLRTLQHLFARATVVFVGYSLRDRYVLDIFTNNLGARPLFGDGPHFLVDSAGGPAPPDSIKVIRYLPEPHRDHRSAMIVLDIIRVVKEGGHVWFAPQREAPQQEKRLESAYFISDVYPPGTWTSSQSLVLARQGADFSPNGIVGQGFDDTELPDKASTAMHDLTVGLISFERLYIPLSCAARLHGLLGSARFWHLVRDGLFRFIYFEHEPIVMFRGTEEVSGGSVGQYHVARDDGAPLTVDDQIRRQIRAAPGREAEVEGLFEALRAHVSTFDHERFNIPSLTRGALLHPSVRKLLGISDAVPPTSFPRWAAFPVIRLASTVMAGCACENFNLPATKIGFGSEVLVGAAFAVSAAGDWADSVSSYVLTSRFNTDVGAYVGSNPAVLDALLRFRETEEADALRREILEELATSAGAEFVASVNAGLRRLIPTDVMESAHDRLSGLLFRRNPDSGVVPSVWTNLRNSDSIARLWRARSRRELEAYCRSRGIRERSPCPCGSGEKLRDCCAESLRS